MQPITLLHKTLSKELPFIHKTRLNCLMSICQTASTSNRLYLTGLGRDDRSLVKTSSNIEKVNRLLGNHHLHQEANAFYQLMASRLIPDSMRPWTHIDWSCINATTNLYVLRASLSAKGRSIVLYEECHPQTKQNNHGVHQQFLTHLKAILPTDCRPILVTDAGFRAPWFKAVHQMRWDFVGRLRHKNLVLLDNTTSWQLSSSWFEQATAKPRYLGHGRLTEKEQVPVHLLLYRSRSKYRHHRNLNQTFRASNNSKRYARAAKEPWLLATSLAHALDNPNHLVTIYRQRMRIEENFRDTKSPHFGLGLSHSLTRTPQRMAILLLIAALATFVAWLAGLMAAHQGIAADFQAHSAKFTASLSLVYLGREVIKKQRPLTPAYFQLALKLLRQMVINTQQETTNVN